MESGRIFGGRFEILRPLGRGSGGYAYLAEDQQQSNRRIALKILPLKEASPEGMEAFEKEGILLKSLSHPNLVRLLDFGRAEDFLYLVFEFIEGQNLVGAAKERDWNAIFSLIVQVARALQYLHDRRIIHRDIKPDNILVGQLYDPENRPSGFRNTLKVIDLGLASFSRSPQEKLEVVGALAYMAPEMLAGKPYDHRTDLYSLGIVLYELALGKHPQEEEKLFSTYLEKLKHRVVDLTPLLEWETPRGIVGIIQRLVEKDPEERLSRADGIIEILNRVEHEHFPLAISEAEFAKAGDGFLEKEKVVLSSVPSLSPVEALEKLREIARSGRKVEAWHWAKPYLKRIHAWNDRAVVEDFFASAIHILIEQGRFEEADDWLRKMEDASKRLGGTFLEHFLLLGNLEYRRGQLKKAEEIFRQVSPQILAEAPFDKQARFENYQGLLSQAQKDWEKAAAHYEKAAELSSRGGRKDHEASLLANAGTLYFEQGKWKKAYELFDQALRSARRLQHKTLIATLTNNLGNLYLYFGRWPEARAALEESLRLSREEGLTALISSNLYLMTVSEEGSGNVERVQAFLNEVLSFEENLKDAAPILQALLAQGYFHLHRKDYEEARKSSDQLLQRAVSLNQNHFRIQARWLLAKVALAQGRNEEQDWVQVLEEVREEAQARGAKMSIWQIVADEGQCALAQGKKAQARRKFQEALDFLEELKKEVPPQFQASFLRDRKKERIRQGLKACEAQEKPADLTTNEVFMEIKDAVQDSPEPEKSPRLSFQKWSDINRRLLLQQQVGPLLEEILDAAIRLTDAERGFVIYSETQDFEVKASRNFQQENLKSKEEQFSYTIAREVMRKGEPMIVLDAQTDERFSAAASVHALSIRSVLSVPLRAGSRTVGLVYLDNRFRQGVFQKEFLPLMEALADQASLVLEHARLHRENQTKIEELQRSKELIEKLNARLERDLNDTTANLEAVRESFKRQNEEMALRYTYDKIIGRSKKMREVLRTLDRIVDSNMNVYIFGESGTGKELVAQAVHFNSSRKDKPFIAENCTALPETLLESELFGHVRGAFTGADRDKIGLFEMAHGGTIFLDEVGDMSFAMQAKLLRVLQEGELRRVGGKDYRKVDVRVISASNKDLKDLVDQGKFRQDLYYRINVVRLNLPPLRDRKEDIPLLIKHFLEEQASAMGNAKPKITKEAVKILMNYDWPGNIRELQNEMARLLTFGTEILPEMISPHILESLHRAPQLSAQTGLDTMIADLEKKAIAEAMERAHGNKVKAARLLRIGRRTLYAKLKLYHLEKPNG